jgi:hypothetical protein
MFSIKILVLLIATVPLIFGWNKLSNIVRLVSVLLIMVAGILLLT